MFTVHMKYTVILYEFHILSLGLEMYEMYRYIMCS